EVSAGGGGIAPFVLSQPELRDASYLLLCSASGTRTQAGPGVRLSLVRDSWFWLSAAHAGDARFLPGTRGVLDADGRAEAALIAPPLTLVPLIGRRLSWAALTVAGAQRVATDVVGFDIVP